MTRFSLSHSLFALLGATMTIAGCSSEHRCEVRITLYRKVNEPVEYRVRESGKIAYVSMSNGEQHRISWSEVAPPWGDVSLWDCALGAQHELRDAKPYDAALDHGTIVVTADSGVESFVFCLPEVPTQLSSQSRLYQLFKVVSINRAKKYRLIDDNPPTPYSDVVY